MIKIRSFSMARYLLILGLHLLSTSSEGIPEDTMDELDAMEGLMNLKDFVDGNRGNYSMLIGHNWIPDTPVQNMPTENLQLPMPPQQPDFKPPNEFIPHDAPNSAINSHKEMENYNNLFKSKIFKTDSSSDDFLARTALGHNDKLKASPYTKSLSESQMSQALQNIIKQIKILVRIDLDQKVFLPPVEQLRESLLTAARTIDQITYICNKEQPTMLFSDKLVARVPKEELVSRINKFEKTAIPLFKEAKDLLSLLFTETTYNKLYKKNQIFKNNLRREKKSLASLRDITTLLDGTLGMTIRTCSLLSDTSNKNLVRKYRKLLYLRIKSAFKYIYGSLILLAKAYDRILLVRFGLVAPMSSEDVSISHAVYLVSEGLRLIEERSESAHKYADRFAQAVDQYGIDGEEDNNNMGHHNQMLNYGDNLGIYSLNNESSRNEFQQKPNFFN